MSIEPLSKEDIQSLNVDELIERMDVILDQDFYENTPFTDKSFLKVAELSRWRVADVIESKMVKDLEDYGKKKIAHICFRFILQERYTRKQIGAINRLVYNGTSGSEWSENPTRQMQHAAFTQAEIISSRICIEYFMAMIYFISLGNDLRKAAKKSTLKKFTAAVLADKNNPFNYFAPIFIMIYRLNKEGRVKEVHANSFLADQVLQMSNDSRNNLPSMCVIVLNIWRPFIDILNCKEVSYWHGYCPEDADEMIGNFHKSRISQDSVELEKSLDEIVERIKAETAK